MRQAISTRTSGAIRRDVQIAQASAVPYSSYGGSSSTYDDGQWHGGYSSGNSYGQQGSNGQQSGQSGDMSSGSAGTGSSGSSGASNAGAQGGAAAQASPVASTENSASSWSEGSSANSAQGNTDSWTSQYVPNSPSPSVVSATWETSAIPTQTASWTTMTSTTSKTSNSTPTRSSTTEKETPAGTTTAASAAGTSHGPTPLSTKLAIGLSVAVAVVAILGFFVWSLHRKKRALQKAIAGNKARDEKPDPSPPQPSMMKRYASSFCNGVSTIKFKSTRSRLRSSSVRLPGAPKSEYKPIKDLALKVYANGRGMLRTAANIARSTWQKSHVHVPRPASEYMHDPDSVIRDGFRQIHRSYLSLPQARSSNNNNKDNKDIHPALRGLHSSTETLVGADMGRIKEVTVSNTPPREETGRIPEANVATVETISRGTSTNSSSPTVSRSPTIEVPTIEIPTSPGAPPISLARVYRVDMDFRPVSPEHIGLKEGQTAILHLVYEDGWALVTVLETNKEGLVPRACFSAQPIRNQAQYLGNNISISTDHVPRSPRPATPTSPCESTSDGDLGRFYSNCVSPELPPMDDERPQTPKLKSLPSIASFLKSPPSFKSMA
ncbi:hypothetical protein AtubIFM56815_007499 [Aspergillus tubingensis]|uniref:SH3 domain-containing protein n=1 Tax=Aspergillus tubingensis TaxID=5068 RepID=A0A9W6EIP9_ASPTU|nr:hypothetical protein AtubIFM54640_010619 [Aspergillus tubingensis]GLA83307.1 hypothetical protein AtubIFM56815_007499 [Aspergillus tubingensis]GLA93683.1 hypothetical protein AtubIFM57143_011283 [Aspergillus tubingensis]